MWKHWKIRSLLSLLVQGSPLREPAGPCSVSGSSSLRGYMLVTVTLSGFNVQLLWVRWQWLKYYSYSCWEWMPQNMQSHNSIQFHDLSQMVQVWTSIVPTRALTLCTVHRNAQCRLCLIWIKSASKCIANKSWSKQWQSIRRQHHSQLQPRWAQLIYESSRAQSVGVSQVLWASTPTEV